MINTRLFPRLMPLGIFFLSACANQSLPDARIITAKEAAEMLIKGCHDKGQRVVILSESDVPGETPKELRKMSLACAPTSALEASVTEAASRWLDGIWEGTLKKDGDIGDDKLAMRILLNQTTVQVFISPQGEWIEAKPGAFRTTRYLSNVVLTASDSGHDGDGTWVESWTIAATWQTHDQLLVEWTRIVNNIDMPIAKKASKFSEHASGLLSRIN